MFFKSHLFSYDNVLKYTFKPVHPAGLAAGRILFGLLMLFDIPEERGGSDIDLRWGNSRDCHFPLFPTIKRLPLEWMCIIYGIMWLGALGIFLGYHFKYSCVLFGIPYWYLLLLEKSFWNNHSYLYGLITILLFFSSANTYWSLDYIWNGSIFKTVPYWNYHILRFQFFILYFIAGLKKTDTEWLEGYSMSNLGRHWVFYPFMILLSTEQIDYIVVHCSGFLLDLTIGFFLFYRQTRPFAMIFCALFHIMNTRLFSIGMFPYVCLAMLPLYCDPDWPIKLLSYLKCKPTNSDTPKRKVKFGPQHHFTLIMLSLYGLLQMFLPYSHFITKGYNNWTNGLYGYSWDMMIHSWDTTLVVIKIVDNNTGKEHFLDPLAWTHNDRWSKHADMCVQYAECLKKNLLIDFENDKQSAISQYITSENISIYFDIWCSLNGRFQQRMFDPNYDMLNAKWSPFSAVEWLLPLLTEYNHLRERMKKIEQHVHSWSNYSDVLFIADFPGLHLENYISEDLTNITLTVMEGVIYYENEMESHGKKLIKGDSIKIIPDVFHRIYTISNVPACYMYTYTNGTKEMLQEESKVRYAPISPVPLLEHGQETINGFTKMFQLIFSSILSIIYDVPMVAKDAFENK